MNRHVFLPTFLLFILCSVVLGQSKEQLLQKIKSGEIQIPQELMVQGEAALQSPGNGKNTSSSQSSELSDSLKSRRDSLSVVPDTMPTLLSLDSLYKQLVKATPQELRLKEFGFSVFKQMVVMPATPTPSVEDYILNPGDELIVYTWGRETGSRSIYIDKDGFFNYPPLAPKRVTGLSFQQARDEIVAALQSISGLQAKVSMGQLGAIRIMILGDVERPGSYVVTSGTTLLNALFLCGGIKEIGSLRAIELKRYGKTHRKADLYQLLIQGKDAGEIQLVSGDIIFVPVVQKKVAVAGFVRRPAIYEALAKEKVSDLIEYAGGMNAMANGERIVVERIKENNERIVLTVSYQSQKRKFVNDVTVEDGDFVKVFPLLAPENNSIVIVGNVLAPGKYQYKPDLTVKDLLPDLSSYKPETFLDYAVTKRVFAPDNHYEYIPFALGLLYSDNQNFVLAPRDTLFIFNRWELLDTTFIEVAGNVRLPGRIKYTPNMRLSDAVIAAGGFKEDTYLPEAHVLKYAPEWQQSHIQKSDLNVVLKNYSSMDNIVLGQNDKVIIFSKWNFQFADSVTIFGEVKVPGKYKLVQGMTVSDLVKHAGGYAEGTYTLSVEVVHSKVIGDSLAKEQIIKLEIGKDGGQILIYQLENGDEVFVRRIIDFGKTISVNLTGQFRYPGIYRAEKGEKLSSLFERAGGFKENAFLPGIFFTRVRVRERQQEHLKTVAGKLQQQLEQMLSQEAAGISADDKAYRDMLIRQRMDMLENLKSSFPLGRVVLNISDLASFKGSEWDVEVENRDSVGVSENLNTISILGEVFAPVTVVYTKKRNTVGECLDAAGGVAETGDEDNTYLIKADGTVVTSKTCGIFTKFNWIDPGPGATIIIPPLVPKKSIWTDIEQVTRIVYQLAVTTGVVFTVLK